MITALLLWKKKMMGHPRKIHNASLVYTVHKRSFSLPGKGFCFPTPLMADLVLGLT